MRNSNIVVCHNVCCFGRKTAFKIKSNSGVEISLAFFHFCSFGFLVGVNEPLEVVFLEFTDIRMALFLSDFNGLIPTMKFLVHSHSFFNFIILEKDSFSTMELLIQNGELSLNSEIFNTSLSSNKLVNFSEIVCLSNISKSGIASLCHIEILLFNSKLGKSFPVSFDFRGHLKRLKNLHSFF
jgi:hypothetical protein